jgi:hypothetical protein
MKDLKREINMDKRKSTNKDHEQKIVIDVLWYLYIRRIQQCSNIQNKINLTITLS